MSTRLVRCSVVMGGVLAAMLLVVAVVNSARWVGTTFPGFFVMSNRVVPSAALPGWPDPSPLFQQQVVAIDGVPVVSAAAVYEHVQQLRPETVVRYTLQRADGLLVTEIVRTRRFALADYGCLFGAYLLCGAAFVAAGLVVLWLKPTSVASLGLLSAGAAGGVFAITGADLYGPHWFFRLHLLAECFVPAALVHLALVFPTNRLRRQAVPVLLGVYLPCLVLATVYQAVVWRPAAFSVVHLVASGTQGLGGLTLIVVLVHDLVMTRSELVRRRILAAGLGTLVAFLLPTVLMGTTGLLGGTVAVNSAALTGLFFPLSIGYAMVTRDLLRIDVFLKYAAVFVYVGMTSTYGAVLAGLVSVKSRLL